jgi:hypothetical protein
LIKGDKNGTDELETEPPLPPPVATDSILYISKNKQTKNLHMIYIFFIIK